MAEPFRNQFQPWLVGKYYLPNLFFESVTAVTYTTTPQLHMSMMLLDKAYSFDQAAIFVSTTSATRSLRVGIYKLDVATRLPISLVEELGTFSLATASPTITLSPSRSYSGLIGIAAQVEGTGGSNPAIVVDVGGDYPNGNGYLSPYSGETSGTPPYAYRITTGLTTGVLPSVSAFAHTQLQANGCGVALRRA